MTPEQFDHAAEECTKALEEYALYMKRDVRSSDALSHLKKIIFLAKAGIPSGQVAEQERILLGVLNDEGMGAPDDEPFKALRSLAAKAHGYEAIRTALKEKFGTEGDPLEHVKELLESEEQANREARIEQNERHRVEAERDAALRRVSLLEEQRNLSEAQRGEALLGRQQMERERDAAVADNAELVSAAAKSSAELRHTYGHIALGQAINPDLVAQAIRILETATAQPHPGAALLEELRGWQQAGTTWDTTRKTLEGDLAKEREFLKQTEARLNEVLKDLAMERDWRKSAEAIASENAARVVRERAEADHWRTEAQRLSPLVETERERANANERSLVAAQKDAMRALTAQPTLRDEFAKAAMQVVMDWNNRSGVTWTNDEAARRSYLMADAMLKERESKP